MAVVPFKHFPLADRNVSWSFSGEDGNRLIERGGWPLFKQVHTWFDDSEGSTPEVKSAYKLPHHKEIDDEVKTVWRGVTAAMARLMQERTQIPEDDRRGCYNHLSRHYREFDEEPPEYGRYSDEEIAEWLAKWGYSEEEAREVLKENKQYSRTFGKPTPSQLEKINALAKRPLSAEEVFTFPTKMVGDKMIYHPWPVTLHKSLLEVFKQDALTGVAFLLDHPWAGFGRPKPAYPYGRTFDAVLKKGDQEGENWALYGDVYIVRGKELDGVSTDAIIASIEDGTLFDVSVGFGNEVDECSICGNNIWDVSKCEHYPGRVYDGQLCYVIAKPPGYLMELSAVFDGAYPGAMVLSSAGGDGAGDFVLLKDADLKKVNPEVQKFRVYSASRGRVLTFAKRDALERKIWAPFSGFNLYVPDLTQGVPVSMSAAITTTQTASGGGETRVEQQNVQEFISKEKAVEVLGKEYDADTILKFAREGIQYREELIQDTIEWGIRAQGNDFPADAWKQLLSEPGRTIEAIKDFREQFKKQAEAAIPAGRKTAPEAGKGNAAVKSDIPDDCFKA